MRKSLMLAAAMTVVMASEGRAAACGPLFKGRLRAAVGKLMSPFEGRFLRRVATPYAMDAVEKDDGFGGRTVIVGRVQSFGGSCVNGQCEIR